MKCFWSFYCNYLIWMEWVLWNDSSCSLALLHAPLIRIAQYCGLLITVRWQWIKERLFKHFLFTFLFENLNCCEFEKGFNDMLMLIVGRHNMHFECHFLCWDMFYGPKESNFYLFKYLCRTLQVNYFSMNVALMRPLTNIRCFQVKLRKFDRSVLG